MLNAFEDVEKLGLGHQETTEVLPRLLMFLDSARGSHFGQTLLGQQGGVWSEQDVRDLESRILDQCSKDDARRFLHILRSAALRWSAETRTKVELPRIPLPPYRYDNPFADDVKTRLERYREAKDLLARWLIRLQNRETTSDDSGYPDLLSTLALSAILHGGLLSQGSLVAMFRAIPELVSRTLIVDGRLHVELSLTWKGVANAELRRWQPDPLTAMLWARTPINAADNLLKPVKEDKPSPPSNAIVFQRFDKLFHDTLQSSKCKYSKRLHDIIRASYVVAHTQIPPIIVRYASHEIISHSLTRNALERFSNCESSSSDQLAEIPHQTDKTVRSARGKTIQGAAWLREDPEWLEIVAEGLEGNSAVVSLDQVRSNSGNKLTVTFADFALWLLMVTSKSGSEFSNRSTLEVVRVVGRYLGPFLEGYPPTELDDETITELYFQAMESTGPATVNRILKGKLSSYLKEFDRYLAVHRKPDAGTKPKFPWFPSGMADVDANPASHDDYSRLLRRIEDDWPNGNRDQQDIAWLLAVLGFRTGLRAGEALYLQIQDVLVHGRGELIVRPTPLRRLKSPNAVRRIPIGVLLSEPEMKRLREWKERRLKKENLHPTDCLFGVSNVDPNPVSEKIFNTINMLMRLEGDHEAGEHFHELRHGFSSALHLALNLPATAAMPFPKLNDTSSWLSNRNQLRKRLFRHKHPERKSAFLLARLLGHASPSTAQEIYTHFNDYLLRIWLAESDLMRPDPNLVVENSGLSDWIAKGCVSQGGPEAISVTLWRDKHEMKLVGSTCPIPTEAHSLSAQQTTNWIETAWDYLDRTAEGDTDTEHLLARLGIGQSEADEMLARAQYLANQHLYPREFRHEMVTETPDPGDPATRVRLVCPCRPSGETKQIPEALPEILNRVYVDKRSRPMVQAALQIYVEKVNRENFVQFANIDYAESAARFVYFLTKIGVPRSSIGCFSGDRSENSAHRNAWSKQLRFEVKPRPSGGDFGPITAISIRPTVQLGDHITISRAAFRFLLVMGYIVFGPKLQVGIEVTSARSTRSVG